MNEPVMSHSEAVFLLMQMSRGVSHEQVEALQLGVRAIVKRHFDHMKNKANRKAKKNGEGNTDGK